MVVSIIALLLGIMLPALSRARHLAASVRCLANVKSFGMGMLEYASENGGRIMPTDNRISNTNYENNWFYILRGQISDTGYASSTKETHGKNIGICPEADNNPKTGEGFYSHGNTFESWVWQKLSGSYGLNQWLTVEGNMYKFNGGNDKTFDPYQDYFYQSLNAVTHPTETPIIGDSSWIGSWPDRDDIPPANPRQLVTSGPGEEIDHKWGLFMNRFVIDRHYAFTNNLVFVDGHAEPVKLPDLWQLQWHDKWDGPARVTVPKPY